MNDIATSDAIMGYRRLRGAYHRSRILTLERQTRQGAELLDALQPALQAVDTAALPLEARERIVLAFQYQRAVRALRAGDAVEARGLLLDTAEQLAAASGGDRRHQWYRQRLLDTVCIALGAIGEHRRTVEFTRALLQQSRSERIRALRLSNLGHRLTTMGFVEACAAEVDKKLARFDRAVGCFAEAEAALAGAIEIRGRLVAKEPIFAPSLLISRSNHARVLIYSAALRKDTAALEHAHALITDVVRESQTHKRVTVTEYIHRAALVGLAEHFRADFLPRDRANQLRQKACLLLQGPIFETYGSDSDAPVTIYVHYGDALHRAGRVEDAHGVYEEGARILSNRCGRTYPPVRILHARLAGQS